MSPTSANEASCWPSTGHQNGLKFKFQGHQNEVKFYGQGHKKRNEIWLSGMSKWSEMSIPEILTFDYL